MDTTGKLMPWARRVVYTPTAGEVKEFKVEPGSVLAEGSDVAVMFSLELHQKLDAMFTVIQNATREAETYEVSARRSQTTSDKNGFLDKATMSHDLALLKKQELDEFIARNLANPDIRRFGEYYLRAPAFTPEERLHVSRLEWTVLSGNFKDEWWHRMAKPSDAILKLGAKDGPWEIEARIPQKHISQVLRAYERNGGEALEIDFLLKSDPTRTYRGKLYRDKIASEAVPNRDEKDESEPEVIAYISIDDESIDPAYRLSRESLTSGTEVHAKVRCGKHRLGYALFYGVWEFLYEKVVFFF
jgi:hypothetical protein